MFKTSFGTFGVTRGDPTRTNPVHGWTPPVSNYECTVRRGYYFSLSFSCSRSEVIPYSYFIQTIGSDLPAVGHAPADAAGPQFVARCACVLASLCRYWIILLDERVKWLAQSHFRMWNGIPIVIQTHDRYSTDLHYLSVNRLKPLSEVKSMASYYILYVSARMQISNTDLIIF